MFLFQVEAEDADFGVNGEVTYKLQDRSSQPVSGNMSANSQNDRTSAITIDKSTGYLTLNSGPLKLGEFTIFIEAADSPTSVSERRTSLAVVVIR